MKRNQVTVLSSLLLLLLGGLAGCGAGEGVEERGFTKEMALAKKKVEVAPVQQVDFKLGIQSTGSLEPHAEANLRALVGGPVVAVHVDIGEPVSKSQVLVVTRPVESELALRSAEAAYETARANLSELRAWRRDEEIQMLRAELAKAQAEYQRLAKDRERAKLVFEKGAISESELQAARTSAESAQALQEIAEERLRVAENGPTEEQIEIARSRLEETDAAVARARQSLDDTRLRAPYSGVVTRRHIKMGDYVNKGDPVLEMADISLLEAETRVPERHANYIEVGISALVTVGSLGIKKEGRVIAVSEAIDQATRTFLVKIGIENADHSLKAGAFCTCDFQLPPLENMLAVPHVAVQHKEGTSYVWVAEGGRVRRVDVTLGARNDGFIQVLNGLVGHEQVVVEGAGALSENDEIEPIRSS